MEAAKPLVRLSNKIIEAINDTILSFDDEAKIRLFGSRTDTSARGGDIDLLILSDKIEKEEISRIKFHIFKLIGERKIDMVLSKKEIINPFVKIIYPKSVVLND